MYEKRNHWIFVSVITVLWMSPVVLSLQQGENVICIDQCVGGILNITLYIYPVLGSRMVNITPLLGEECIVCAIKTVQKNYMLSSQVCTTNSGHVCRF